MKINKLWNYGETKIILNYYFFKIDMFILQILIAWDIYKLVSYILPSSVNIVKYIETLIWFHIFSYGICKNVHNIIIYNIIIYI